MFLGDSDLAADHFLARSLVQSQAGRLLRDVAISYVQARVPESAVKEIHTAFVEECDGIFSKRKAFQAVWVNSTLCRVPYSRLERYHFPRVR